MKYLGYLRDVGTCKVRHGTIVLDTSGVTDRGWRREVVIRADLPGKKGLPAGDDAPQVTMGGHKGGEGECCKG